MIREWASADQLDMIEEALMPDAAHLAQTWDDDEAWATFEAALRD